MGLLVGSYPLAAFTKVLDEIRQQPRVERLTPQIVQLTDWSTADMNSPRDTSRHGESRAVSRHQPGRYKLSRRPSSKRILGIGLALCVPPLGIGLAACGGASSSAATTSASATATQGSAAPGSTRSSAASNARSTNAAGGSVGSVTGVSTSSFTVSTPTGEKVTVKKTSSTVYDNGTKKSVASAVTKGKTVLVLGKVDSTTITASEVIVGPAINLSKASTNVIAFKSPNQSESKSAGQIPAN